MFLIEIHSYSRATITVSGDTHPTWTATLMKRQLKLRFHTSTWQHRKWVACGTLIGSVFRTMYHAPKLTANGIATALRRMSKRNAEFVLPTRNFMSIWGDDTLVTVPSQTITCNVFGAAWDAVTGKSIKDEASTLVPWLCPDREIPGHTCCRCKPRL